MHALLKMITGTFFSRISGFLRDILLFSMLGASMETSAFLIAFAIPNLFRRLCGEGALSAAFIPVFSKRYAQHPTTAAKFLNIFFSKFGVYLGVSTLCVGVFLRLLMRGISCSKWYVVCELTTLMLPYLWFICTAALLNGTLNVLNAFAITAFSPILLNLTMILGIACCRLYATPMQWVMVLSLSVVIGGFFQWILPKRQLKRKGYPVSWCWEPDEGFTEVWHLFVPSILGVAIYQINALCGRLFAYAIDPTSVSFLYLANRFLELPLGLFAFSIISILLPKLSLSIAQNDTQHTHQLLHNHIQLLQLLLIPSAIGLACLASPILNVFFCWNRFASQSVEQVVPLLRIFTIGLPLFGLTALFPRIFYAHHEAMIPVKISFFTFIAYLISALGLSHLFQVPGLVWASVVSNGLQLWLQIRSLQNQYPNLKVSYRSLLHIPWISNILLGLFLVFVNRQIPWSYNKLHDTLYLGCVISAGLLIYGLGLLTLERKYFSLLQPLWKRYLQKR